MSVSEPQSEPTYDVVLLIEQPISRQDAAQVRGLHEGIEEPVRYHVLLPIEDAAARVESAMGSLAASEVLASPAMVMNEQELQQVQRELLEDARKGLDACVGRLSDLGADAVGEVVSIDPIDALAGKVDQVGGREAIILTRPHVVAEFFHLDWTSRARRKIGVPCLHLLEHEVVEDQGDSGDAGDAAATGS